MKNRRVLSVILIIFTMISIMVGRVNVVKAQQLCSDIDYKTIKLRAGGGSSSSSGGGSSSHSSSGHSRSHGGSTNIITDIIFYIFFLCAAFSTAIMLYLKVLRSSFHSKRYLKILDHQDIAWNYKTIEKQVIETFYIVQEAWTQMNMAKAKNYMDDDLYNSFKVKLEWMEVSHKRNILKKIRLINLKPVSVYDDEDDAKDLIWFYIKGKMIDYTINTENNEKIEGSEFSTSFVEFWKFVRKDNKWLLSKILQQEESNKIEFQ